VTNVVRDVLLAVTGRATWTPFVIGSLILALSRVLLANTVTHRQPCPTPKPLTHPICRIFFRIKYSLAIPTYTPRIPQMPAFFSTDPRQMTLLNGREEKQLPLLPVSPQRLFASLIFLW
jgi:hypothetical protein